MKLICWLLGHVKVGRKFKYSEHECGFTVKDVEYFQAPFCRRCGVDFLTKEKP